MKRSHVAWREHTGLLQAALEKAQESAGEPRAVLALAVQCLAQEASSPYADPQGKAECGLKEYLVQRALTRFSLASGL